MSPNSRCFEFLLLKRILLERESRSSSALLFRSDQCVMGKWEGSSDWYSLITQICASCSYASFMTKWCLSGQRVTGVEVRHGVLCQFGVNQSWGIMRKHNKKTINNQKNIYFFYLGHFYMKQTLMCSVINSANSSFSGAYLGFKL